MRTATIVPLAMGLCWAPTAYGRDCHVPHFRFVPGGTTQVQMITKTNTPCDFHFQSGSSERGDSGILTSEVLQRPQFGILGHSTARFHGYKPDDNYVGQDEFDIHVRYDHEGDERSTTLHVDVTIAD